MTDTLRRAEDPQQPVRPEPFGVTAPPMHDTGSAGGPGRFSYGTNAGRAAVVLAGIGVALVGVHALGIPTPPCPLRSVTGVPGPFCGLTHLAQDLLGGQFGRVAAHDPAGLVLAAALGIAVVAQLVAMVRKTTGPAFMISWALGAVVLVALAVHWVTTIITGGLLAV